MYRSYFATLLVGTFLVLAFHARSQSPIVNPDGPLPSKLLPDPDPESKGGGRWKVWVAYEGYRPTCKPEVDSEPAESGPGVNYMQAFFVAQTYQPTNNQLTFFLLARA